MDSSKRNSRGSRVGHVLVALTIVCPIAFVALFQSSVTNCGVKTRKEAEEATEAAFRDQVEKVKSTSRRGETCRLNVPGLENVFALSSKILSGSGIPDAATRADYLWGPFKSLAKLGVTTIVSVDGTFPDADEARRHGLRYVHIPIGYDTVSEARTREFAAVVSRAEGRVYFHCHHGRHRGPVAAALAARVTEGWSVERAAAWLEKAGTAPRYAGLFEAVLAARLPTPAEWAKIPVNLPERADVPPLTESMARLEVHVDRLKLLEKHDFAASTTHPDLDAAQEALQIEELLREIPRTHSPSLDFRRAIERARAFRSHLESGTSEDVTETGSEKARSTFAELLGACSSCHQRTRNVRNTKYRQ